MPELTGMARARQSGAEALQEYLQKWVLEILLKSSI